MDHDSHVVLGGFNFKTIIPAGIYPLKLEIETLEQGVKYVQI